MTPRPRRPARAAQDTTQAPLDFTAPAPPRGRAPRADPDQIAKAAIARRTKPAATPGHVRLTLTLELPRELAERLSARAIREEKNLELLMEQVADAIEAVRQHPDRLVVLGRCRPTRMPATAGSSRERW